ncbi:MAG TPA: hypothetical protein VGQ23_14060 [Burkholderiaceae bacterium]|nr:hypothetical protein [Burkholderiaceae bacterium]
MSKLFSFFSKRARRAADAPAPDTRPREQWSASEWARVRAPARMRDAELSMKARNWLERLPDEMRPRELCTRFPRIANQLAACWDDIGLIDHLLQDLLIDRRGGREGFPAEVIKDLALLYEYHDLRLRSEAIDAAETSSRA